MPLAVGRLRPPVALSLCSLSGVVCCFGVRREIRWPLYRPDGRFGSQELDGLYHWNSSKSEAGGSPETATASATSTGYHPSPHATPYRCHSKKQPISYTDTLLFSFLIHSTSTRHSAVFKSPGGNFNERKEIFSNCLTKRFILEK